MITKDAVNEKRYLTKTKNKISKALAREESIYIQYDTIVTTTHNFLK